MSAMSFIEPVRAAAAAGGLAASAANALANLMAYVERGGWRGACHACSSVLYVALSECGLHPTLCIGECRYGADGTPFDHSWVLIDDKPYDIACAMRLDTGEPLCPPVIGGIDVITDQPTELRYGISSAGLDLEARMVSTLPFVDYMDGYPNEPDGLWTVVGACMGKCVDVTSLRRRYASVRRVYVRENG